jgi:signal transduction histidine kinase
VSVASLLERIVPSLERRAEDAGMVLRVHSDAGRDAAVETDLEATGQILYNLVDNACKYAQGASDRTIELRVECNGRCACIDVADHGPGVAAGLARRIFTPFERGAGENGEIPGIGLGLALCRGLARDLGGDLELLERNGKDPGASFRLTLLAV